MFACLVKLCLRWVLGLGGLSVCSDEVLLKIFDLLDPKSLATLALVSKACFCFAYFEDYWKGFVLEV